MNVYLAGLGSNFFSSKDSFSENTDKLKLSEGIFTHDILILESFYNIKNNIKLMKFYKNKGINILLDSGAFTFLNTKKILQINWDNYINEYADFINKWDIKLFFELDIDSIIGIKEVERLREKLESLTNKKCIPVWHKNRGKDYFIKLCQNYNYVAIGGLALKEIPIKIYEKYFPWFIKIAHDNNCKIHALGYTRLSSLQNYNFDSIDSTTWLSGKKFGKLFIFDKKIMNLKIIKKRNFRAKPEKINIHNIKEWIKFTNYLKK